MELYDLKLQAKNCIRDGLGNFTPVTRVMPWLIRDRDIPLVREIAGIPAQNSALVLPEVLTLFNAPALPRDVFSKMLISVFSESAGGMADIMTDGFRNLIGDCNARLGKLGFSFPRWRHATQSFEGAALVERFGMERLHRATDLRDPHLFAGDPARDRFGPGFVYDDGKTYIELRRAYIVCSRLEPCPHTLVIRNNSSYFGRDRLPNAVYLSFDKFTCEELSGLTEGILESDRFIRWQDLFVAPSRFPLFFKLQCVKNLLDCFEAFDKKLINWLLRPGQKDPQRAGLTQLIAYLEHGLETHPEHLPYLGAREENMPPWFPQGVVAVDSDLIDDLRLFQKRVIPTHKFSKLADLIRIGLKFTLLSHKEGDYPVPLNVTPMPSLLPRPQGPTPYVVWENY
jgi:hypothetical protein